MQRSGFKSGLLFTTSLMTAALGYSRRAYASCTIINPGPPTRTIACSGISTNNTSYTFSNYTNINQSVTVGNFTVFSTNRPLDPNPAIAGNQITIVGDGNLVFNGQSYVVLEATEPGFSGVYMRNTDTLGLGNVTFTQAYADPTYDIYTEWGIFGTASGVTLINTANGSLTATANGLVRGVDAGLVAQHTGTGNIVITTGPGGSIEATGTDAADHGLVADHDGTGAITITLNGDVTAAGGNAVNVTSGTGGTGVTVNLGSGDLDGNQAGLFIENDGTTGGVTIQPTSPTAPGTITGQLGDGIRVENSGPAGVSITTGAGDITGGAAVGYQYASGINALDTGSGGITITVNGSDVTGDAHGIRAQNLYGGALSITTNAGDIQGLEGAGINADNSGGAGGLTVLTGTGSVTGGTHGIQTENAGDGGTSITTTDSLVEGLSQDGIFARDLGTGGITVSTGAGEETSPGVFEAVRGGEHGINLVNSNGTSINVTTGSGSVTGEANDGIFANNSGTGGISITTGTGAVIGGANAGNQGAAGVYAFDTGAGDITILTQGDVTGDSAGVLAQNFVGGSIDITTGDGDVLGEYGHGVLATNFSLTGTVTITTGEGSVTGNTNDGIYARNSGSGGIEIITGPGAVTGGANAGYDGGAFGIEAYDTGAGGITITTNGDVTGDLAGIFADNEGGGDVSVTTNDGDILGVYGRGIIAQNSGGTGSVTVTTGAGTVTGNTNDGIYAFNTGSGGVEVTTGSGDITGGAEPGNQYASGIDARDTGTGGIVIIVNDSNVTGDSEGVNAFNVNGGSIEITTNAGDILGVHGRGITAQNFAGTDALTITTGDGTVTGNLNDGIYAFSTGTGGIEITTGSGAITGGYASGNNGAAGIDAIDVGTGSIVITVNDSDVTGDEQGIRAYNSGGGSVEITTNAGNILAIHGVGIDARNFDGTGSVTVTTGDGTVTGNVRDGINAFNQGTGGIEITTGSGDITGGANSGDDASFGINAIDVGSGSIVITVNDSNVTGDRAGVQAFNANVGSIEITTFAGDILGVYGFGIYARNVGPDGSVTVTTGDGTVTGNTRDGIYAFNVGTDGIEITTGSGDITGGANLLEQSNTFGINALDVGSGGIVITVNDSNVTGDTAGVRAFNTDGGSVEITTNAGNILGLYGRGIYAQSVGPDGTVTVTTGDGTVTGNADDGTFAFNVGSGGIEITTGSGDITGGADTGNDNVSGIEAYDVGAGGIVITVNDSNVTGDSEGIRAYNVGGGSIDITTNAGSITGLFGRGIETYNFGGTGGITIATGDGAVTGFAEDGISARNTGDAGIVITTGSGDVVGGFGPGLQPNAYGIRAVDSGTGDVEITTNDGNVYGDGNGIFVQNYGGGDTTVTTNAGNIRGTTLTGIAVTNGATGGALTITTNDGTVTGGTYGIFAQNSGTGVLSITTGDGDIRGYAADGIVAAGVGGGAVEITLAGSADVTGGRHGINGYSTGGALLIDASAATGVITGIAGNGINAVVTNTATGDLTIVTGDGFGGVAVLGDDNGIYARNLGTGAVSITTGAGSVTGTTEDGIYAFNDGGTGVTITTGSGTVQGYTRGIYVENQTGYVTIDTYDGNVIGRTGIEVYNDGDGGVTITTRDAAVIGTSFAGIEVRDYGLGGITITTGAGDSTGVAVQGANQGIEARNYYGGSIEITVADGDIIGTSNRGIFAYNGYNNEDIIITLTGAADVFGGVVGIGTANFGIGGTVIDAAAATGVVEGGSGVGIYAYTGVTTNDGITITTGAGDGTDAVIGGSDGIVARNRGDGSVSITTGTGAVTGRGADGIRAFNSGYGQDIEITTGTGTVRGFDDGIQAVNYGSGDLTITTIGQVIGEDGNGISARNGGFSFYVGSNQGGDLTITTYDLVEGGTNGIFATNDGLGGVRITTNAEVRGNGGDGINASNGQGYNSAVYGTDLIITANDVVSGSNRGIVAVNEGRGYTSITTAEDVTGEGGDGIFARNGVGYGNYIYGTDLTIVTEGGVFGEGGDGIDASNIGTGALTITTNGVVRGDAGNGILASNGYVGFFYGFGVYGTNLVITTTDTVTGSAAGIVAVNSGLGFLSIDAGDDVIGEGGDGIRAINGSYYDGTAYGTNLTITTNGRVLGQGGDGIDARNRGTGQLVITTYGVVDGDSGDGIRATNGTQIYGTVYGTNLIITANETVTGSANGISAINTGNGFTEITTNAAVEGEGNDGIFARNGTYSFFGVYGTDLRIYANDTVSGAVDGIDAANTGTGELLIITQAAVTGDTGNGISARNGFYYFSSNYGTDLTIETNGSVTGQLDGINALNSGNGALDITANGDVTGRTSDGIFAQNSYYGTTLDVLTGAGTTVLGAENGIIARNFGSGDLTVDVQGAEVTGTLLAGISTYQSNGPTTIVISGASTVQGGTTAIFATSGGGALIDIDNAGVLRNLSGLETDTVVFTVSGPTELDNSGQMTGRIQFGAFDDILTNSGTWLTGGTSDFGGGADSLSNTNLIIAASRAGVSETTRFDGLESFTNSGVIRLSDETAGNGSTSFDRLEIAGDFNGVAGSLELDAFLGGAGSQADVLVIGGTATGTTAITITNTNPGTGGVGANILLVDTGGSTGSEFFLSSGPINVGAYVYDLFWDGEDFFLQSALDVLRLDAATFPAILGDIWDITAGGWHRNTYQLLTTYAGSEGVSRGTKGAAVGGTRALGWGTAIFDSRNGDGTIISDVGGSETPVDISFDQNTRAMIGGVDLVMPHDGTGGTFTVGALLGVIDSRVDYALTGNTARFDGTTYGLHVAYANDVFRADLLVKRDDLDLEYDVAGLSDEPGRADAASTGVSLELGYKVHDTGTMSVEAVGNLSHVATRIDSFTVGPSTFDFDRAETTRGAIGLTFRGNYSMGTTIMTPSATLKYWNVFDGGYTSAIDAVAFSYDGTGSYVEASAMLEFKDPGSGWSGFVSGSGFLGGERSGARAQVGLNFEW